MDAMLDILAWIFFFIPIALFFLAKWFVEWIIFAYKTATAPREGTKYCKKCGYLFDPSYRFCTQCGKKLK